MNKLNSILVIILILIILAIIALALRLYVFPKDRQDQGSASQGAPVVLDVDVPPTVNNQTRPPLTSPAPATTIADPVEARNELEEEVASIGENSNDLKPPTIDAKIEF